METNQELTKLELRRAKNAEAMREYRKNNKAKCAEYQKKYYHRVKEQNPEAHQKMLDRKKLNHKKNKNI